MNNLLRLLFCLLVGISLYLIPAPEELSQNAWNLFIIFFCSILTILTGSLNLLQASLLSVSFSVLTKTISSANAFQGFANKTILLIIVAFIIARAVIKSGLGERMALNLIKRFGSSSLRLGYCTVLTDMIIAVAFPSNTARSGAIFPIVESLAINNDSHPGNTRKRLGSYLMLNSMVGLVISSLLWYTGKATNFAALAIAKDLGIVISFTEWLKYSIVPTIIAFITMPYIIYKIFPPQIKDTPNAPALAKLKLKEIGPMTRNEILVLLVFIILLGLWASSGLTGLNKTATAFLGMFILTFTKVINAKDIKESGALETYIWFAILFSLSASLNKLGFMDYIGNYIAYFIDGYNPFIVYLILILSYFFIHYLFVSQSAQIFALYAIFLMVAINSGLPKKFIALQLIFATGYQAIISPQGSASNVIFCGSGYLKAKEVYKFGGFAALILMIIYSGIGALWMLLLPS